jgi:hypothetical protein
MGTRWRGVPQRLRVLNDLETGEYQMAIAIEGTVLLITQEDQKYEELLAEAYREEPTWFYNYQSPRLYRSARGSIGLYRPYIRYERYQDGRWVGCERGDRERIMHRVYGNNEYWENLMFWVIHMAQENALATNWFWVNNNGP